VSPGGGAEKMCGSYLQNSADDNMFFLTLLTTGAHQHWITCKQLRHGEVASLSRKKLTQGQRLQTLVVGVCALTSPLKHGADCRAAADLLLQSLNLLVSCHSCDEAHHRGSFPSCTTSSHLIIIIIIIIIIITPQQCKRSACCLPAAQHFQPCPGHLR